jgi:phage shock protein A
MKGNDTMATHFFSRMTRLIRADAHGVLDQLEERSLLLKQHLREAEIEVDRKRAALDTTREEEAELGEERGRLLAEIDEIDEDVELALAEQKDELARFAVRRLLPRRELSRQLERRLHDCREQRERLAETLALQTRQLEELRGRVRVQVNAARIAHERRVPLDPEDGAPDEAVELELLRRQQDRGQKEEA